jgi:protein-L-isoaspartate(D-aspartate) O-methyltransferase
MTTIATEWRRYFAEEIQVVANVRTPAIVEALATVPREAFLPEGPWTIRGEADIQSPPRQTPGTDPRFVSHNIAVAIDVSRMLFNGAPGLISMAIDALEPRSGDHALHLGAGTGYYSAILGAVVGSSGRVLALEVDNALAARARTNLESAPHIEIRTDDGSRAFGETFDVALVNAGLTHLPEHLLDAMRLNGRLIVPITATMPGMGPIGKGPLVRIVNTGGDRWSARAVTFVAIYSAIGLRDETVNAAIGQALARHPFPPIKSLRRDPHDAAASCWCHVPGACLSLE